MKLYDAKSAPNPRRVRIFAAEKRMAIPTVEVDLNAKENQTPEFRAKNPLGGVPVLELDDGTCIAESVAICRYLEGIQPDPPLMGTDAKDRAIVEMWQRRMELEIFQPIANVFVHTHEWFKGRRPLNHSCVCTNTFAIGWKISSSIRRCHISTSACPFGPTPMSGGSGWISSRYRQIATDSEMHVPSSSSSTGTPPSGFFFRNSGARFSFAPRSTWRTGTSMPFSARKMRTRRGLGADFAS